MPPLKLTGFRQRFENQELLDLARLTPAMLRPA
jgi:hypothetical protein